MNSKTTAALILICASALTLSACGSGDPDDSKLQSIKDEGVITIATSGNNRPTIYRAEDGGFVGSDADWAKIISNALGVEVEWEVVDFSGIIPGLQAGRFDGALSGLRVTEERAQVIDFSDPIGTEDAVVVYPTAGDAYTTPEEISGETVCVVAGSSNGEGPVNELGTAGQVVSFPGVAEAFSGLQTNRCDILVTGRGVANDWIKNESGGEYAMSKEGIACTDLAFGVPKGSTALLEEVNAAIAEAKESGEYDRIGEEWFGGPFPECTSN